MNGGGSKNTPPTTMKQYTLLINSITGREGQVVALDDELARQLSVNGIVDLAEPDRTAKTIGPEVVKVTGPTETKRGRPRNDSSKPQD